MASEAVTMTPAQATAQDATAAILRRYTAATISVQTAPFPHS